MRERTVRSRRLQAVHDNVLGFDATLSGVRMKFEDITGTCPFCQQGPAGMTVNVESPNLPEKVKVRCNNNHWSDLAEWNKPAKPAETATMIQNPEEPVDPLAPVTFTIQVTASRSALELLAADFNPTKSQSIGRMKQHVAALITQAEQMRDREAGASARACAIAITKFEEAALFLEKALRMLREP